MPAEAESAGHQPEPDSSGDTAPTPERHLRPVEDAGDTAPAGADEPDGATSDGESHRSAEASEGEPWTDRARRYVAPFRPESGLYTDRQPSIEETVRRARDGGQVPDAGPLRTVSQAHGYVAAGIGAVCDTTKWVAAHPARCGLALTLLVLAALFPPTREVLSILLTPAVWLHTALS